MGNNRFLISLVAFAIGTIYFAVRIFYFGGEFVFDQSKVLRYLIIVPIAEEIIFRGVAQEFLERKSMKNFLFISMANLTVSVMFSLVHFTVDDPMSALVVFVPSLIFGTIYSSYRSVIPCILCHTYYNLNVMII